MFSQYNRAVVQTEVAIASKVSNYIKNSLAISDLLAKKAQLVNHCENPFLEPPVRDSKLQFSWFGGRRKLQKDHRFCKSAQISVRRPVSTAMVLGSFERGGCKPGQSKIPLCLLSNQKVWLAIVKVW